MTKIRAHRQAEEAGQGKTLNISGAHLLMVKTASPHTTLVR